MACCSGAATVRCTTGLAITRRPPTRLTQAQADSCCASSERENSNQSSPSFVTAITAAVLGPGVVLPVTSLLSC